MDKLGIINRALMKCGLPLAASLNDCDWNASVVFDDCAIEVLRSFCWGFAQKFVALPPAGVPPCGFERGYQKPADCLRIVDAHCMHDLRSPRARQVRTVGNIIYAQVAPCYLRYVSSDLNLDEWPPDFTDAVACRIAYEIAPLSTQTMALTPQLVQLYQVALEQAKSTDARENVERVPKDIDIWASRAAFQQPGKRG